MASKEAFRFQYKALVRLTKVKAALTPEPLIE